MTDYKYKYIDSKTTDGMKITRYRRIDEKGNELGIKLKRKKIQYKSRKISTLPAGYDIRAVFFDTETKFAGEFNKYGGSGKAHFEKLWLGWARYGRFENEKFISEKDFYFKNNEDLWNWFDNLPKGDDIYIFAWNMDFDINIIDAYYQASLRGWKVDRKPFMGDSVFAWYTERQDGQRFAFYDGMNFCGGKIPLAAIGDAVGLPKQDIERDNIEKYTEDVVKEYCLNDVNIVIKYLEFWFAFLKAHNCGKFKITLASQCFEAYKKKFPYKYRNIRPHPNDARLIDLERAAYHGGWVETFFIGRCEHVYHLDVNSFHPFIMSTRTLPYRYIGDMLTEIPKNPSFFLIDADIDIPKPLIPIKLKGRGNVYPIGTFRAQFTSIEHKRLLDIGGKVLKVYRLKQYETSNLFRGYIDEFYALKEKYSHESKDKPFRNMSKYFQNSLEGKFAQRDDEYKMLSDVSPDVIGRSMLIEIDSSGKKKGRQVVSFGGKSWCETGQVEARHNFIPVSATIRAWTRVLLSIWKENVERAGGCVYYIDTDSLFVDEIGYDAISNAGLVDDVQIGKLKVEHADIGVEFFGAKSYKIDGESLTWKGVSKRAVWNVDHWEQTKFLRSMSMVQYGQHGTVIVIDNIHIKPSKRYRKGKRTSSGWVKPIVMTNNIPEEFNDSIQIDFERVFRKQMKLET